MGTNFYRVNIPTEEDIKKLHKLVDEGKLLSRRGYWGEEDSESVQDIIDDCTKRELFGGEPEMNDFFSEGLRFAVFSDFC